MSRITRVLCIALALALCATAVWAEGEAKAADGGNPVVVMKTNQGTIEIELWADKAPITVENFLKYVDKGHYKGTIFHRVIKGFMIQGGGFNAEMTQKPADPPIKNEADNGEKNVTGTLAMARTNVVDSATAQFFINTVNNPALDHTGPGAKFGYAVFGKVISGMDVVQKIENIPTGVHNRMRDVPTEPMIIESVERK